MDFPFDPPARPVLPIAGQSAVWPVRRVFCVGRNYAAHAREMGHDEKEPPFFFTKPADAVCDGGRIPYPPGTSDLHHEVELVAAIGRGGSDIGAGDAMGHVWGYAVGIDLTRRDLQAEAKKQGRPWDMAKGFDASAPIGKIVPATEIEDLSTGTIRLSVDGDLKQDGDLSQMIWSLGEIISHLSALVALAPGDLIMTGTPDGVGRVDRGEILRAEIEGLPILDVTLT